MKQSTDNGVDFEMEQITPKNEMDKLNDKIIKKLDEKIILQKQMIESLRNGQAELFEILERKDKQITTLENAITKQNKL